MMHADLPAGIGDAWSGIPGLRLSNYMIFMNMRKLFPHKGDIPAACNHPYMISRANRQEPVDSHLNEGTSGTQYIHELLWQSGGAHRPETAAYAAGHYHYMRIHITNIAKCFEGTAIFNIFA
jgi:hypothetical protein